MVGPWEGCDEIKEKRTNGRRRSPEEYTICIRLRTSFTRTTFLPLKSVLLGPLPKPHKQDAICETSKGSESLPQTPDHQLKRKAHRIFHNISVPVTHCGWAGAVMKVTFGLNSHCVTNGRTKRQTYQQTDRPTE